MYRFRRIENLLGKHKELENQEIYFCDINELNDPMEGFREVYWDGDIIVWQNLLRHYLLCLEDICIKTYLYEKNQTLSEEDISIFKDERMLPTEDYKNSFKKICDHFFNEEVVNKYLNLLLSSRISRDELYVHLKLLHMLALRVILEVHKEKGLQPESTKLPPDITNHLYKLVNFWQKANDKRKNKSNQEKLEILFEIQKEFMQDIDLMQAYKTDDSPENQKKWFVLSKFPNAYLNQLMKLTYPEAYVACFMEECTNAAVWGHYANGHRGVCLKFNTKEKEDKHLIALKCIVGMGSDPIYDYRTFQFRKIEYVDQFSSIVFVK